MSIKMRSNILLVITAMIWGAAFVAQKAGTVLEPFTYNFSRSVLGAIALLPLIFFMDKKREKACETDSRKDVSKTGWNKTLIMGGIATGIVLAVATNLQQLGLTLGVGAGKAGFITTLYIIMVPLIGIFIGKKIRPIIWFCVLLGAVGFYMLTLAGKNVGLRITGGDLYMLLCALGFACHILVVDHFSPKCDGIKMSCIQFAVAGFICFVAMLLFENPNIEAIKDCWLPIAYCGICSSGIGYTLQIVAQKHAEPTTASLIMSLESVFATISGTLFLSERMTAIEWVGCAVIFVAVILAQLPSKEERLNTKMNA